MTDDPRPTDPNTAAARALAAFAAGDHATAAKELEHLSHIDAIGALLVVGSAVARFAAGESGIPTGTLLAAVGARTAAWQPNARDSHT